MFITAGLAFTSGLSVTGDSDVLVDYLVVASGDGSFGIVINRHLDNYPSATNTTCSPIVTITGKYRIYKFTNLKNMVINKAFSTSSIVHNMNREQVCQ